MEVDESGKGGWKWMKVDKNVDENGWKSKKIIESSWKWIPVDESGWKCMEMDKSDC